TPRSRNGVGRSGDDRGSAHEAESASPRAVVGPSDLRARPRAVAFSHDPRRCEMSDLKFRQLHPALGAEVEGFEPKQPLDGDTVAELRKAFDDHGVLLFRDLDIDEDYQRYLVFTLIGEEPPAERPEQVHRAGPMLVSNREEGGAAPYGRLLFHCDTMWAENPQ